MDFAWGEEQRTFRATVRDFIAREWGDGANEDGEGGGRPDRARAYQRALAANGWLTMAWPKQYGGGAATPWEQMIFAEESAFANAPTAGQGADRVGPVLMIHGTEAQKQEHLTAIAEAREVWCQGYSEPGAGSDLASLQTRAVREGDEYVLNGQKIWTSGAQHADWIHVLTRSDPDAPKHRGITYLMVPMTTPGISLRPITQMHDAAGFNETFFEDVRVPAANVIGEPNRGWYVAATALDFERSGIQRMAAAVGPFNRLLRHAQASRAALSYAGRMAVADTAVEVEVARLLGYRVTWMQSAGLVPNQESSMSKMFGSELQQRNARRGLSLLGLAGALRPGTPQAAMGGEFCRLYMSTVSVTVAAGTSEIQRNIIATRGLGLPRG